MIEVVSISKLAWIGLAQSRIVTVQRESSAALSQGFRLGFLGTLHMDVLYVASMRRVFANIVSSRQRLEDEHSSNVIITAPTVPYKGEFHAIRCPMYFD